MQIRRYTLGWKHVNLLKGNWYFNTYKLFSHYSNDLSMHLLVIFKEAFNFLLYFPGRYLGRFADELEQIELVNSIKGRSGFQHASRLQSIKVTMETEPVMLTFL